MIKIKYILLFLILIGAENSYADEYYSFFSIKCVKSLNFVSIESFSVWNVGDIVWPIVPITDDRESWLKESWKKHETNLKELEDKYGIYVFGKGYGRYISDPIKCEASGVSLTISADPITRKYTDESGIDVQYRGPMKINIEIDGVLLFKGTLNDGSSLHVDGQDIEICNLELDKGEDKRTLHCEKPY